MNSFVFRVMRELGARIITVCDAFDAMTSDRPYRAALPFEKAIEEVRDGAGTQFDPVVAGIFIELRRSGGPRLLAAGG